jgi:decaprenylphospho-beta-D-erythro-pentofuranosid-2-ulose 2-reductase
VRDGVGDVQSVVVFGGTSEIALALVRRLIRRRCRRVVLAVRDVPAGGAARRSLETDLTRVAITMFDAAAVNTHRSAVDEAFAAADGDVDVVLVAFGQLGERGPSPDPAAAAAALAQVNYVGAVSVLLRAAQHLRRQGHGTIVVLSSVAGVRVRAANFVYGASKAGLDAFAQGLADSLVGSGVDLVIVRPGFVRTRMTAGMPEPPFAVNADDVAMAIEHGVRTRRSIVWVPPVLQGVFLLMHALPRAVWRRLPTGTR